MSGSRPELAATVTGRGGRVDGARLDGPARQFAERLSATDVRPEDIVVLDGLEGRALVLAALACWLVDAVPFPVPKGAAPPLCAGACVVTDRLEILPAASGFRVPGVSETAVLHLSSGTTERPKVARRGLAGVLAEAAGYRAGLSLTGSDHVAVPLPLTHSFGWGVTISALLSGCAVDLQPVRSPGRLAGRIDAGAVSVLALSSPLARLLTGTRRRGPAGPRVAMVGAGPVGDDLDAAFASRFGVSLRRGYGCTETGGTFLGRTGIGDPIPGVRICHPPPGGVGELRLELPTPVQGYLGEPGDPGRRWATGDIVRRGDSGDLFFLRRAATGRRLNSRWISTEPAADALRRLPGVAGLHFLVVPSRDSSEIEELHVLVEGRIRRTTVLDALAGLPAGNAVPVPWVVRRIPRTTVGKVDPGAVAEIVRGRRAQVGRARSVPAPAGTADPVGRPWELVVADHVAAALAGSGRTVDPATLATDPALGGRDLTVLGLDSLGWMAVAAQLEDVAGVELPDHVLADPAQRNVAGWARALRTTTGHGKFLNHDGGTGSDAGQTTR